MTLTTSPAPGRSHFLAALDTENDRLSKIWREPHRNERNDALAAATRGLDLTVREWYLLEWFLTWDCQDELAAIITKAREQGNAGR